MLEILGLMYISNYVKKIALSKGRKPRGYVAMSIILWFVFEFIGLIISIILLGDFSYIIVLGCAALSLLVSFLVMNSLSQGDYIDPIMAINMQVNTAADPLHTPARVDIVREKSFNGVLVNFECNLNGQFVGSLQNNSVITVQTMQRQNIIELTSPGQFTPLTFHFDIGDGGFGVVFFKSPKFRPEKSQGIFPITTPSLAYTVQPGFPPAPGPFTADLPQVESAIMPHQIAEQLPLSAFTQTQAAGQNFQPAPVKPNNPFMPAQQTAPAPFMAQPSK